MNLYVIEVRHPKLRGYGILTYFVGRNDLEVYEFLRDAHLNGEDFITTYADNERDAADECYGGSPERAQEYRNRIINNKGTLYGDRFEFSENIVNEYGWELVHENVTPQELQTLVNLGIELRPKGIKMQRVTKRSLNKQLTNFNGYGKTDTNFKEMLKVLYDQGLVLSEGKIEYSDGMASKSYNYKISSGETSEDGDWVETKVIGYLSATKYFINGLDNPYEILVYMS